MVALHFQLASARSEGKLEAMVVADDAGLVLAAAGPWAKCEELAAYAPLLARGHWAEPGVADADAMAELGASASVQSVEVGGQRMLLCARGGTGGSLARRAEGVARILAA